LPDAASYFGISLPNPFAVISIFFPVAVIPCGKSSFFLGIRCIKGIREIGDIRVVREIKEYHELPRGFNPGMVNKKILTR